MTSTLDQQWIQESPTGHPCTLLQWTQRSSKGHPYDKPGKIEHMAILMNMVLVTYHQEYH